MAWQETGAFQTESAGECAAPNHSPGRECITLILVRTLCSFIFPQLELHMLQSSGGARWALRLLKYMRLTQALAYLQAANEGAEVVFGGDLNWIEEEQGELPLPGGWYALLMPRLQLRALLVVWGSAHWREGWYVLLHIGFSARKQAKRTVSCSAGVTSRMSHASVCIIAPRNLMVLLS